MKQYKKLKTKFDNMSDFAKKLSTIVTAIITMVGIMVGFGQWIVTQITAQVERRVDTMSDQINRLELDTTRIQLTQLITHTPESTEEILKVARHYFNELHGDWYMDSMFVKWASENDVNVDNIRLEI